MRILIIDSVCGIGSTGRLCKKAADEYVHQGHEVKIAYGRESYVPEDCKKYAVRIGHWWDVRWHALMTRIFDFHAFGPVSRCATKRFLVWAEEYNPEFLWLNSIHGYHINAELLFKWIKSRPRMHVEWTQHDCWAFTGHCSHFLLTGCERWKTGCYDCPEKHEYPATFVFDNSKRNWAAKRTAFCGVSDMKLVAPSQWLANLTRESFLREYPVEVVRNKIDLNVFKPTLSDVKKRLAIDGKVMILGVASQWDERKGLPDFYRLRELLDARYAIVLVGLTPRQISALPKGIIGIARTNSAKELAELYSAADWFFNPTREDNYPTVNLEAVACGCKVVTYDTGGCAETVEGVKDAVVLRGGDKSPEGFVNAISA